MNIKLPKLAIIDNDEEADRTIIEASKSIPFDISRYISADDYLKNGPSDCQVTVLDTYMAGGDLGRLEKIIEKAQKGKIIVATGKETTIEELKTLQRMKILVDTLDKPKNPQAEGYEKLYQEAFNLFDTHRREGAFHLDFPVGVIGGGNIAIPLITGLAKKETTLCCYSPFLCERDCVGKQRYKSLALLTNLVNNPHLNFYGEGHMGDFFANNPGVIVFAASDFQQTADLPTSRDRREVTITLYDRAVKRFDRFIEEYIKFGSDATIFVISNPPETFCRRAIQKYGINPFKIVSESPDVPRLKLNFEVLDKLSSLVLTGEHAWPRIVEECAINKDGTLFGHDKDPFYRRIIIDAINQSIRSFGPEVLEAYRLMGGRYPFTDTSDAMVADIDNLRKFRTLTSSIGYLQPQFEAHLLGPAPIVDSRDLSIHSLEDQRFLEVCNTEPYFNELTTTAKAQKELAKRG